MIKTDANARRMREANNAFKSVSNVKPMTDYAKAEKSIQDNRERLKAERLAREADAKESSE
ncbi:hypothetical protein [Bradyrhizobium sp. 930_D9_N1_4]|uniref:hypothetical protein n=1 Tax=Bradyrhizobium sp. 930_D9_N1_4 TaxID=3240374 RepID=UPI003F8BFE6F